MKNRLKEVVEVMVRMYVIKVGGLYERKDEWGVWWWMVSGYVDRVVEEEV